jgi:uncharacterized phage-associated protein
MKHKLNIKTTDLAKDIIFICKRHNIEYGNTKIQKLLYLFIGFALMNDIEEIRYIDELPKAWQYGPVFPKIYKQYNELINIEKNYTLSISSLQNPKVDKIIEKTVQLWGSLPAGVLSDWSHKTNSPWDIVVNKNQSKWNAVIPLEMIYNYFAENVENVLNEKHEKGLVSFIKNILR